MAAGHSKAWYVYLVECRDGSLYTGIARDVQTRVAAHNDGGGARYTRSRRPVRLVYKVRMAGKSQALRREHAIKQLKAADKRRLVARRPIKGA
ncbi:MAG: GIY-YIG nuclease family protein [Gammaproteobacteria bacterium]|nr:GIY-YIG nuclease family protein [Gammaproteobacteria bacterium]